jgi:electron transfer flavoprotein alpha subunit
MKVLVIAEHNHQTLLAATLPAVTAATKFAGQVDILVAGDSCSAVAEACTSLAGVSTVLLAQDQQLSHQLPESITPVVMSIAAHYQVILTTATTTGKSLMPRIAALLGVAQISEVVEIQAADTFVRPIYAGNALATVQSSDSIKVLTIRGTAFEPVSASDGPKAAIQQLQVAQHNIEVEFVTENLVQSARPELTSADIVIAGGRGLGSAENFQMLERLADKLGAAIGASRAAVDAGYASNDLQVGQTGKVVAPSLYIAVGISGAIQHLAGMKDSKVIVAINKDPEAPIFQVADYGLVGDLFEIMPALESLC